MYGNSLQVTYLKYTKIRVTKEIGIYDATRSPGNGSDEKTKINIWRNFLRKKMVHEGGLYSALLH